MKVEVDKCPTCKKEKYVYEPECFTCLNKREVQEEKLAKVKLGKMKWKVWIEEAGYKWQWSAWEADTKGISVNRDYEFKSHKNAVRNFERFAKANEIKDFKYV